MSIPVMPGRDQEDDSADDSRTAAVGSRNKQKDNRVTKPASQSTKGRRSQRNRRARRENTQDFVPRGATFTNAALPVDGDSSNGSNHSSDGSDSEYTPSEAGESPAETQRQVKTMQPTVNWNRAGGGGIRTSLRGAAAAATASASASASATFDAVNEKYWHSQSGSPSNAQVETPNSVQPVTDGTSAEQIPANGTANGEKDTPMVISDDSELESDVEADNSILLNLRSQNQHATAGEELLHENASNGQKAISTNQNGLITPQRQEIKAEADTKLHPASIENTSSRSAPDASKAAAIDVFKQKYPSAPNVLGDLNREDRDVQVKYVYYNTSPKDIDLNLPIRCTDCMVEGHLSEVCPSKEVRTPFSCIIPFFLRFFAVCLHNESYVKS